MKHVLDVWYQPHGPADMARLLHHELPADEWPADHDTLVTAILARYERDYGTVTNIHLRSELGTPQGLGRELYKRSAGCEIWVTLLSENGGSRKEWSEGETVDEAINLAIERVTDETGDDTWAMDDWGAA